MPRQKQNLDPNRQLMIKVKTCQRLQKEAAYYKKEVEENTAKLSQMKEDKRDPYDIKKFEEVLGESLMMIPDSASRLKKSIEDLATFLDAEQYDVENEWCTTGKAILAESKHSLLNDTENNEATDTENLRDDEAF